MSYLLILTGLLAFSNAYPQKSERQVGSNEKSSLSVSISEFHSTLWPEMSASELGNIFYSPFSLYVALSQIYFGSPKGSNTNSELASFLHLKTGEGEDNNYLSIYKQAIDSLLKEQQLDQRSSSIRIANRMYSAQGLTLKKNFKKILESYFSSTIEEVVFSEETADKINQFVSDQTNGLIKEVIKRNRLGPSTTFVLLNAIYFKGTWKYTFNPNDTQIKAFHVDNTRQTNHSAMSVSGNFKVASIMDLESDILELPYNDGKTSMIIVLPNQKTDIRKVENLLGHFGLNSLIDRANEEDLTPDVKVVFPSYETAFDFSDKKLEDAFARLGVATIFDPSQCDLSEIANEKISISTITHKAVIKVNEEGSEAAAVTVVEGSRSARPFQLDPKQFIIDRPFLLFIVDHNTKLPLFAGRIVDPSGTLSLLPPQF